MCMTSDKLTKKVHWCELWDARGAEILNCALLVMHAIWFMLPLDAFEVCIETYYIMSAILTDDIWGAIMLVLGIAKFFALWKDSSCLRKWFALICGVFWLYMALCILFAEWRSTRLPMYLLFAINMFRVFFCIKLPKGYSGK